MNICIFIFSRRIIVGAIGLTELLLSCKLNCLVLVCVYVFTWVHFVRTYFIIGLFGVKLARK
jgi:hypothetical protein